MSFSGDTAAATSGDGDNNPAACLKPVPGSYGIPFFSPIKDRLAFFSQPPLAYFQSLSDRLSSTVLRVNMPPGPFISGDSRVVALLDSKSFPALFDLTKVHKHLVLEGTYAPSAALTGGYRPCAYLDPSDPKHSKLKTLILDHLLAPRKLAVIPSFIVAYSSLLDAVDNKLAAGGGGAVFNDLNDEAAFEFVGDAFFGVPPSSTSLRRSGHRRAVKWLGLQLHPILTLGLPKLIEEIFLHTFPLPPFLVRSDYKKLYDYFLAAGAAVLEEAEKLGLPREEACHNVLFAAVFNAFGGIKVFFPSLVRRVAEGGAALHAMLAVEVREVVAAHGGKVTAAGLEKMKLVKSVVWEALRLDPPVPYQYARAKKDFIVESHDGRYLIKEGEMVFGFQPMATRDEWVFERGGEFVPERFVGEDNRRQLLRHVLWSNGPETEAPALGNKQCAGKDMVVTVGRLLVVVIFLRYDSFTADVRSKGSDSKVTITSVMKAAGGGDGLK
ncbi:Allene oxide synthase, chloroplastic [Apostasia shenzhenica]|uniref:Allene oxide synthase, chloroplastic n=1 Tax=Apostasia shenzhenica TaxID=1088818 RepID=A0A2I0B788_9ASPA|nr:Allene oxide synthase, chloroplastic [Apostasia shenzhenica]